MEPPIPIGSPRAGFTLMEMLVVLVIASLLASIAAPAVMGAIMRARETALKQDLNVMRKLIDDYHADRGSFPASLDTLVEEGYLRAIPPDPASGGDTNWDTVKAKEGGIQDIKSRSRAKGTNGVAYADW